MINYIEKGKGLHLAINAVGHSLQHRTVNRVSTWHSTDDVAVQAIIDTYDPLSYERTQAKSRIVEQSQESMQLLEDSYPSFERQTFPQQRSEILAWEKDNTTKTPTIDAIAVGRGRSREEHLTKVLEKSVEYHTLATTNAGERQRLEDVIDIETDFTIIQKINFEVS